MKNLMKLSGLTALSALASLPEVALKTLHINLAELIGHLQETDEQFARIPLAEMVRNAE